MAGGLSKPFGDFESSIELIESGKFDHAGFKRLHIAGHPEGNKDIDPDGASLMLHKPFPGNRNFLKEQMLLWQ